MGGSLFGSVVAYEQRERVNEEMSSDQRVFQKTEVKLKKKGKWKVWRFFYRGKIQGSLVTFVKVRKR